MKNKKTPLVIVICLLIAAALWMGLKYTNQDSKTQETAITRPIEKIEKKKEPTYQTVKTTDNGIILFDASSSMKRPYQNSGRSMYAVAVEELKKAAAVFPEIGHQIGLYLYNGWKPVYPAQTFNRQDFAAALENLPPAPKGPTLLMEGLTKLDAVLQQLSGKTAVFIYTDGRLSPADGIKPPHVKLKELADKYSVCFYFISTAESQEMLEIIEDAGQLNDCSQSIPLKTFIEQPGYNEGALYEVKKITHHTQ